MRNCFVGNPIKDVYFSTYFLHGLSFVKQNSRVTFILSPQILQVLDVDQLIDVEEVHFAAHWLRALLARGVRRLLAKFPLGLTFPGRFVKFHPRGQLFARLVSN
jgi:hypothetical protein